MRDEYQHTLPSDGEDYMKYYATKSEKIAKKIEDAKKTIASNRPQWVNNWTRDLIESWERELEGLEAGRDSEAHELESVAI